MQLAAHEVQDLNELTLSCVNSITNMACFKTQVQDPELLALIEQHFPLHIKDYNIKVEYLSKAEGATSKLPIPDLRPVLSSYTQAPVAAVPVTPRTTVQQFNDREIATAYLLTLKRAGPGICLGGYGDEPSRDPKLFRRCVLYELPPCL